LIIRRDDESGKVAPAIEIQLTLLTNAHFNKRVVALSCDPSYNRRVLSKVERNA
jgi:hypothetical protein